MYNKPPGKNIRGLIAALTKLSKAGEAAAGAAGAGSNDVDLAFLLSSARLDLFAFAAMDTAGAGEVPWSN